MNYKIRVENEAESKEVQGLFFELGGCWATCGRSYNDMVELGSYVFLTGSSMLIYGLGVGKEEISIPQLRDLVVLKRNDVNDRNVTDPEYSANLYLDSKGDLLVFHNPTQTWKESNLNGVDSVMQRLNLIEKPMKEYLRKNSNGTYSYIGTVRPEHVSDFMIEIPEGAEVATSLKFVIGAVPFLKRINDSFLLWSEQDGEWGSKKYKTITKAVGDNKVLWQRHTQPEELPFVDDEPKSLNDQYAEIEQARKEYKSNHIGSDLPDFLFEDTVNHPSHYASGEIECIDAIESSMTHEAFCGYLKGNVQKYMWRYENKGGITDLEKAQWYLNKLISRIG